jgi:hypothetical protein
MLQNNGTGTGLKYYIKKGISFTLFPLLLILSGSSLSCSLFERVTEKEFPVTIHELQKNFIEDYQKLLEPKGIMPTTLDIGRGDPNIILKVPANYYEYYIFDRDTSLVVLSYNPFIYLKIHSREIASHLNSEYMQFLNNVRLAPSDKKAIVRPFFHKLENLEIAVLFSPTQLHYGGTEPMEDKISVSDTTEVEHPAITLENSPLCTMYTPKLEDPVMYSSLVNQATSGKQRFIYTTESVIYPPIYSEVEFNLNFSFMAFSDTPAFETISTGSYNSIILLSTPLGNTSQLDRDYLNISHGVTVILKGDITPITDFLTFKGIDFENPPPVTNKLFLTEDGSNYPDITLEWVLNSEFTIEYRRRLKNPVLYPNDWEDAEWVNLRSSHSGLTFVHQDVERGYDYHYRVIDNVRGGIAAEHIIIGINPDARTTANSDTGALTGSLAFSEINLTRSIEASINSMGSTVYTPKTDAWFEIKNISPLIVKLDAVNFYYRHFENPAIDPADILFGPDCPDQEDPLRRAVDVVIYPGEYHVITRHMKYMFADMLIYNADRRYLPAEMPITNYLLEMRIAALPEHPLHSIPTNDARGRVIGDIELKSVSHVYGNRLNLGRYEWMLSTSSFRLVNPMSAYAETNNCTPGHFEYPEYQ